jgi:cytochrome P450
LQDFVPSDDSIISRALRAKNKETGTGLTDKEVVAQSVGLMIGGALSD